jgi:phosphate transport system permease protein
MPLLIYRYAIGPYDDWHQQAWAAAFVLMMIVLVLSIFARVIAADRNVRS